MAQVQNFLTSKGSYLATYVDPNLRITPAQAIYDSARLHRINPKYILVLLQKEQSLIENDSPGQNQLDWATGYGICDSCKKTDAKVQKYKGLVNQVDWGTGGTRYYLDNPNEFKYQTGQTFTIDNQKITIANDATRALYIYTPHLHGNKNFYNIWQNWFSTSYFEGSLLQDSKDGGIYLIRDGKKHPFLSKSAFLSRYPSFDRVIPVNPSELDSYPLGNAIEHSNYSLLQIPTGGIYLLDDDTLRPIASKKAFRLLGYNPEEIIHVKSKDIFSYKIGKAITETSIYPTGALLQDNSTGGVYFVQNGIKQPILDRELINLYYKNKKIYLLFFFFFKQKTAYEIYQCDWSSDVCSSDLKCFQIFWKKNHKYAATYKTPKKRSYISIIRRIIKNGAKPDHHIEHQESTHQRIKNKIGRASCRERV